MRRSGGEYEGEPGNGYCGLGGARPARCGGPSVAKRLAFSCHVMRYNRPIGGGEVDAREFSRRDPADGDVFMRMRLRTAKGEGADERNHLNRHGPVVVRERRQVVRDVDRAAEFFTNLANQGGGGFLAGFHLAAGELPFEPEVLVRGTLRDQDFAAIVLDHRADDRNGFRHGPSGGCRLPGRKRGTAHAWRVGRRRGRLRLHPRPRRRSALQPRDKGEGGPLVRCPHFPAFLFKSTRTHAGKFFRSLQLSRTCRVFVT